MEQIHADPDGIQLDSLHRVHEAAAQAGLKAVVAQVSVSVQPPAQVPVQLPAPMPAPMSVPFVNVPPPQSVIQPVEQPIPPPEPPRNSWWQRIFWAPVAVFSGAWAVIKWPFATVWNAFKRLIQRQ